MDGVCPLCGVLRYMSFQWMERILQDEIEFCCRLCPRTKGLWNLSTCEGLSSNTSKPCMTEVHHRMVKEEERMKLEDGRFFQQRKQAIHAKCPVPAVQRQRAQLKQWMPVQPPHMLKPYCKAKLVKSKGSDRKDDGKQPKNYTRGPMSTSSRRSNVEFNTDQQMETSDAPPAT